MGIIIDFFQGTIIYILYFGIILISYVPSYWIAEKTNLFDKQSWNISIIDKVLKIILFLILLIILPGIIGSFLFSTINPSGNLFDDLKRYL